MYQTTSTTFVLSMLLRRPGPPQCGESFARLSGVAAPRAACPVFSSRGAEPPSLRRLSAFNIDSPFSIQPLPVEDHVARPPPFLSSGASKGRRSRLGLRYGTATTPPSAVGTVHDVGRFCLSHNVQPPKVRAPMGDALLHRKPPSHPCLRNCLNHDFDVPGRRRWPRRTSSGHPV